MKTIVALMLLLLISCGSSKNNMKEETNKDVKAISKHENSSVFETLVTAQMTSLLRINSVLINFKSKKSNFYS